MATRHMSLRPMSAPAVAVALALASIIGCRETTAPTPGSLVVDVAATTVRASRSGPWAQFKVPVTLRNPGDVAVRVEGCGPDAEREVSPEQWQTALSPNCALVGSDVEIPAHGELAVEATVVGSLSSAAGPMFLDGVLGGRYRLAYYYSPAGFAGSLPQARSAPFEVTE
jgi:hypothetical protein